MICALQSDGISNLNQPQNSIYKILFLLMTQNCGPYFWHSLFCRHLLKAWPKERPKWDHFFLLVVISKHRMCHDSVSLRGRQKMSLDESAWSPRNGPGWGCKKSGTKRIIIGRRYSLKLLYIHIMIYEKHYFWMGASNIMCFLPVFISFGSMIMMEHHFCNLLGHLVKFLRGLGQ